MALNTTRRRFLLRGALGGGMVTLALPLLDCFLDANGEAMAASVGGGRLPVRFGSWYWGCGMIASRWTPKTIGADYDLLPELAPIKDVKQHISILSNFSVELDGRPNLPHMSGMTGMRTGSASESWQQITGPTFDVQIADAIGAGSYTRALDLSADGGGTRTSMSYRNGTTMNPATTSAVDFYKQTFGPDFHDPNAADFKPDPKVMLRRSVLSGVSDGRKRLMQRVGASDRTRLDQYFTSVREMEDKLALQLQKPPRAEACALPSAPPQPKGDLSEVGERRKHHKLMAEMLAMALACNQTKVFNMSFSGTGGGADLRHPGQTTAYHQSTHEEMVDRTLGYQPKVDVFVTECMSAWAEFVTAFAAVKEGNGTLLDNTLVLAHSEVSFAKDHDISGLPMMFAGRAGGRIKSGLHVDGGGAPVSRAVLTAQQAMGVPVDAWGQQSMRVTKGVSELTV